jgi:hypothetical protein
MVYRLSDRALVRHLILGAVVLLLGLRATTRGAEAVQPPSHS